MENSMKSNYLDRKVILSEGLIDSIIDYLLRGKRKQVKDAIKKMQLDRIQKSGILKDIDTLNKNVTDLEKEFEKRFGKKVKLNQYKLSDFVKMVD